jgi:hypothetical protein
MAVKTFTSGETLTASDTNTYLNSGGLVYVTSASIGTGVSSVTVTGAFSSTYDNYKIVMSGGSMGAQASIKTQLGASTTGYYAGLNYVAYASGAVPASASNNLTAAWEFTGYGTAAYKEMSFDLISPFLTKYTQYCSAGWVAETAAGTSSGIHVVETSYSSIVFIPNGTTMTGGTVTVYGYRKA